MVSFRTFAIKHYYIDNERLACRIGDETFPDIDSAVVSNALLSAKQLAVNAATPDSIVPDKFDFPSTLQESFRHAIFWQHSDHLGSASWITDTNGNSVQHLQYMPWGEPLLDYRNPSTSYSARYTFSGKERDEETGYSYFGARYYNSTYSIWMSVDPMSDKYPSLSPYAYCGNNPVKLVDPSGEEVADDIIIHGKNNSSITIKTDLVDWNINANVDFGGNYELESDRVAIGYEYGIDASGRAGAGTSYTAYKQSVMFLGGPYSGYWYDYLGGEAQIDVSASAEGTIGVHKNFFIASTSDPKIYNPENFAGAYYGASLSGSWKAIGGLSLDAQCAISKDKSWKAISFGVSGSIGPQIGFFAGFSGSIGGHFGKSHLVGDIKPTKQRSSYDIGMNWLSHLFF